MKSYLTLFIAIKAWRQLGTNLPTSVLASFQPILHSPARVSFKNTNQIVSFCRFQTSNGSPHLPTALSG